MKKTDYFQNYKTFKVVQLVMLVLFAIVFFLYLYMDETLRTSVYTNKSLLTICVFLWAFMIYSFISIIWDFHQLQKNIVDNHVLNRTAYLDNLTGMPNRNSCDMIFEKYEAAGDISHIGCALISISNLHELNAQFGRDAGNRYLQDFSSIFEKLGDGYGFVGRNGGNEFIAVLEHCTDEKMNSFIGKLTDALDEYNASHTGGSIALSCHTALNRELGVNRFSELMRLLYNEAKKG
ncbi:MAG: diguanylate cyclase [Lachnospiraceae bacterium]|nr:diguanylate cyclase [Lachnospiraceae bacterium]